ncbi:MAG: hypothetical protein WCL06_13240, partial [Bacteroidota bacterium]
RALPVHLSSTTAVGFYALGVIVLSLLALLPIAFSILLVSHLVLLTLFILIIGAMRINANFVKQQERVDRSARIPYLDLLDNLSLLNNRLLMLQLPSLTPAKKTFATFYDDAKYLSRDSQPGGEAIEAEIIQEANNVKQHIQRFEMLTTQPTGSVPPSTDPQNGEKALENAIMHLRHLCMQREELLKRLRQSK